MSNKPYKGFEPKWLLTPAPADSYRSIFAGATRTSSNIRKSLCTRS